MNIQIFAFRHRLLCGPTPVPQDHLSDIEIIECVTHATRHARVILLRLQHELRFEQ